ncbi:MAG: GMC family oxidoreductase [Rhodospirillaceae bacterium]|nr:GMC family oxidoreductase [Rhodospirillaceae bacterium]
MCQKIWDVVIIGSGSAGCVAAATLSAAPNRSVLVLEAGRDTPPGREPDGIRDPYYARAMQDQNFWPGLQVSWISDRFATDRNPSFYEQARIMGGGSSVNSMVAIRALPEDFAEWTSLGLEGWAWDDILPYFMAIEADQDFTGDQHGRDGPIPIRRHATADWPEFCKAIAQNAATRGLPFIDDMNADFRDGYTRVPMSSLPTQRMSAAMGFLTREVRSRPNLTIATEAHVNRIVFDGRRAIGVEVDDGTEPVALRTRSVVLAAGAIHSPAILQRSGIGRGEILRDLGIDIVSDRHGIGQNLQEHPTVSVAAYLKPEASQKASLRAHANLGFRISSSQAWAPRGDVYASVMAKSSWHALGRRMGNILISLHKPLSRGEVRLRSADPRLEPAVAFRFFDDPRDMERMVEAVRCFWSIAGSPDVAGTYRKRFLASYSPFVQRLNRYHMMNRLLAWSAVRMLDMGSGIRNRMFGLVLADGRDPDDVVRNDQAIEEWICRNATGFFHPVGTCAMGPAGDPMSVVDSHGKLIEIDGVWVVDASVMPRIVRATTNITTMAVALKLSQLLSNQAA